MDLNFGAWKEIQILYKFICSFLSIIFCDQI